MNSVNKAEGEELAGSLSQVPAGKRAENKGRLYGQQQGRCSLRRAQEDGRGLWDCVGLLHVFN